MKQIAIISRLERKFDVKRKVAEVVQEEVRQRLVAVGAKLERYDNRTEQYRQNQLFESNQKRLFNEYQMQSRLFWSDIQDQVVMQREITDWLRQRMNWVN